MEITLSKKTLAGIAIAAAVVLFILMNSIAFTPRSIAAQAPQALPPCGPASQLSEEFATNVDAGSRCFELRMYTADPERDGVGSFEGGIDELHQRFREEEVAIFEKHGADVIGVWQDLERPNTLVWMLAYRDLAHREEVWRMFGADPAWEALRNKYNVPLQRPQVFYMSATDYSDLK